MESVASQRGTAAAVDISRASDCITAMLGDARAVGSGESAAVALVTSQLAVQVRVVAGDVPTGPGTSRVHVAFRCAQDQENSVNGVASSLASLAVAPRPR